jgi:quercetin dioxygenase-like cupin family protein
MSASRPPPRMGGFPVDVLKALAGAVAPAELGAEQRQQLRQRVLKHAGESATPDGTFTLRASQGRWVQLSPGVEVRVLRLDKAGGTHTSLFRMQPGGQIPAHRHSKDEEFFVLQGECHIGALKLSAGDAHTAPAGSQHGIVTTRTGVLVMLRGEYPFPTSGP